MRRTRSQAAGIRHCPLAASPFRCLSQDLLHRVIELVPATDSLCTALTCKPFRHCIRPNPPVVNDDTKTFQTRYTACVSSPERMEWVLSFPKLQRPKWLGWGKSEACAYAARGGHLEMVKFLHEKGCPWDADTTKGAAGGGHLDMLKFLHEKGCPWNEQATADAASGVIWMC